MRTRMVGDVPAESLPVTVNGKVVGHTEGADIVITDEATAARLRDHGRLHVSVNLPGGASAVSDLAVRPKAKP